MPAEWALEVMRKAPYITVSFIRKDGPFGRKQMLPDGRSQGRLIHASIPLGSGIRPR